MSQGKQYNSPASTKPSAEITIATTRLIDPAAENRCTEKKQTQANCVRKFPIAVFRRDYPPPTPVRTPGKQPTAADGSPRFAVK